MSEITVSGNSYEEALESGLKQLGISRDLLEIETLSDSHDDTLPGAEPLPGVTLRIRIKQEELIDLARKHLQKILELIGVSVKIEKMNRRGGTTLNILAGEDGALIIGKNGQNLEALQYLINRMVVRGTRDIWPITIDSEGYREKRIAKLEDLARRTAERVLRQRRDYSLEPMPASERKIIHMALRETRGVHTISRGEDNERHIVITYGSGENVDPRKFRSQPRRRNDNQRGGRNRPPKRFDENGEVNGNVREDVVIEGNYRTDDDE